ncbi:MULTISPECIES: hypothetical protein [unclassified Nocardioides]|nr:MULTISPECIES: hypothetical protein [unclassified Nocardioides]
MGTPPGMLGSSAADSHDSKKMILNTRTTPRGGVVAIDDTQGRRH